eukprot:694017-Rhodomonas_salina.1
MRSSSPRARLGTCTTGKVNFRGDTSNDVTRCGTQAGLQDHCQWHHWFIRADNTGSDSVGSNLNGLTSGPRSTSGSSYLYYYQLSITRCSASSPAHPPPPGPWHTHRGTATRHGSEPEPEFESVRPSRIIIIIIIIMIADSESSAES